MRSIALLALVAILLAATPGVQACGSSAPLVQANTAAGHFYVVFDVCQPGCIVSTHVYMESNGQSGLQRQDAQVDNTCGGQSNADTRII